jgi:hypothetical protein
MFASNLYRESSIPASHPGGEMDNLQAEGQSIRKEIVVVSLIAGAVLLGLALAAGITVGLIFAGR